MRTQSTETVCPLLSRNQKVNNENNQFSYDCFFQQFFMNNNSFLFLEFQEYTNYENDKNNYLLLRQTVFEVERDVRSLISKKFPDLAAEIQRVTVHYINTAMLTVEILIATPSDRLSFLDVKTIGKKIKVCSLADIFATSAGIFCHFSRIILCSKK